MQKFFLIFLVFPQFFWVSGYEITSMIEKYISKYHPTVIREGDHVSRQYPKNLIEVTQTFGMTEQSILFVEAVVEEHFNGRFNTDALNTISETIQGYLGGHWGVSFYEDPYMFFSTSVRRSPSFVVLDVNGKGVAVMKNT